MVNCIQFDWSPGWIVGIDAGYWIPLLARRATASPPMVYPLEWNGSSRIPAGLEASRELLLGQEDGVWPISEILGNHGVTHVFTDAQHWPLVPRELSQDAHLKEVYHQDRVWVFKVMR